MGIMQAAKGFTRFWLRREVWHVNCYLGHLRKGWMKLRLVSLIPLFLLLAFGTAGAAQKQEPSKAPPKAAAKTAQASLSGCVDQAEDGNFVLINNTTRDKIANLVAEGFPTEGFAKYLGHKVTVRGTASPGESSSNFRVRSVEVVGDGCGQ